MKTGRNDARVVRIMAKLSNTQLIEVEIHPEELQDFLSELSLINDIRAELVTTNNEVFEIEIKDGSAEYQVEEEFEAPAAKSAVETEVMDTQDLPLEAENSPIESNSIDDFFDETQPASQETSHIYTTLKVSQKKVLNLSNIFSMFSIFSHKVKL